MLRNPVCGVVNFYDPAKRNVVSGCRSLCAALSVLTALVSGSAFASGPQAPWIAPLLADLATVDTQGSAKIGVYVRDLDTGSSASYQGSERWYIASMVKVPVAIAVLRGIERGQYTLGTRVSLRAGDYVDGAGPTNSQPLGTALPIRYLLEQMMKYSDNTATDMLIDLVGIAQVNETVAAAVPEGFTRITSLSEIRKLIYGYLVPNAHALTGQDLILLNRQRVDADRLQLLSRMVDTPVERFLLPTLGAAYKNYYDSGLNSARLDAYGDLLAQLADGKLLNPKYTDYLLALMERTATGTHRLKAGLPSDLRFAHKTGTQRGRICDAGLARLSEGAQERRVVVVACTRDELSLAQSEAALMQVGVAICRSGLLTRGVIHASGCHAFPHHLPHTDRRLPAAVPER